MDEGIRFDGVPRNPQDQKAFTDDDLKQLQDYINIRRDLSRDVPVHPDIAGFFSEVDALLIRLEAAERCITSEVDDIANYEAWRKAAGK